LLSIQRLPNHGIDLKLVAGCGVDVNAKSVRKGKGVTLGQDKSIKEKIRAGYRVADSTVGFI
jgi:hypothetical protein